jgi:hypothetical protein
VETPIIDPCDGVAKPGWRCGRRSRHAQDGAGDEVDLPKEGAGDEVDTPKMVFA